MGRHVKLTASSLLGHLRTTTLDCHKHSLLTRGQVQKNTTLEGSAETNAKLQQHPPVPMSPSSPSETQKSAEFFLRSTDVLPAPSNSARVSQSNSQQHLGDTASTDSQHFSASPPHSAVSCLCWHQEYTRSCRFLPKR